MCVAISTEGYGFSKKSHNSGRGITSAGRCLPYCSNPVSLTVVPLHCWCPLVSQLSRLQRVQGPQAAPAPAERSFRVVSCHCRRSGTLESHLPRSAGPRTAGGHAAPRRGKPGAGEGTAATGRDSAPSHLLLWVLRRLGPRSPGAQVGKEAGQVGGRGCHSVPSPVGGGGEGPKAGAVTRAPATSLARNFRLTSWRCRTSTPPQ